MASNEFVRNLLIEQRKRLTGSLMTHIERNVYPHLSQKERQELREKVLASIGVYHDTCLDMVKASVNDGSFVNEEALLLLRSIHGKVK